MPGPPEAAYFELAPDWVCEILSPSTRKLDLGDKREIYAHARRRVSVAARPDERRLEAFALRDGAWLLLATLHDDAAVSVAPFEAISFPLSSLFWGH